MAEFQLGDRVRVLTSGGNWYPGTIIEGDRMQWDRGDIWPINSGRFLRRLEPKPVSMTVLDDALEGEMTRAIEIGLPELKVGDRVRVVLAGPPLEHLLGAVGTVKVVGASGLPDLVSVQLHDDWAHSPKLFRRTALDLVEAPKIEKSN